MISIITVCFNAAQDLEKTILNVKAQKGQYEHVIIDGGSTDNTVNIIQKYKDHFAYWISEPDKGIYDAMNKGICQAKGNYILFLNAGDELNDTNILVEVQACDADVVYGDYIIRYPNFNKMKITPDVSELDQHLPYGMCLNHQSVFFKNPMIRSYPYSLNFKLAADFHQLLCLMSDKKNFKKINRAIATFDYGGISSIKKIDYLKECRSISLKMINSSCITEKFNALIRREKQMLWLRKILGEKRYYALMEIKNSL